MSNLISERGRALIVAAAVLDRPNADPDDDMAILARQLSRCAYENEQLKAAVKETLRVSGLTVLADKIIALHALVNEQTAGEKP